MKTRFKVGVGLAVLAVCGVVGKAIADGIPTMTPLAYSGVLQNSAGAPVTTQQSMQLTVWDDAAANASMNQKCVTPTQNVSPDAQGRFQIVLDQACFDAVRANPNLWVQVQVGATVLPRTKINAVPYAVEAAKASRVVFTAASGIRTTTDGVYCGATPNQTGRWTAMAGALTGYRAGKRLCEQACSSPTAHACSDIEAARYVSLASSPLPTGWLVTGRLSHLGTGGVHLNDCEGFTNNTALFQANTFENDRPWGSPCTDSHPILCCD